MNDTNPQDAIINKMCYYNKTIKKCVQASAFLSMNFLIRIQDDMYNP